MNETTSNKLLPEEIYAAILDKIQNKDLKIGDKIPSENEICREFHVSRVSARSAIQKLQAQNLIVTRPGRGSFVASDHLGDNLLTMSVAKMDLSKDEYRYVIELRKALEFTSVDLMCQYGTEEDFNRLEDALTRMKESGSDLERYVKADYDFHVAIIKGSHNPLFVSVFRGCRNEFMKYFTEMAELSNGDFGMAIGNHTRICQALKERNAEETKRIIEGTFEYNLGRFKDMFKEN